MTRKHTEPKILFDSQGPIQVSGQCDCNCDCACSPYAEQMVRHIDLAASGWPAEPLHRSDLGAIDIGGGYRVCCSATSRPVVLNPPAFELLSRFNESTRVDSLLGTWQTDVSERTVLPAVGQMLDLGLLVSNTRDVCPTESFSALAAWLHVTDRCNLRCAYCYLPHNRLDMSPVVGRAAIDATVRSALDHSYTQVKLKYGGGEPLLRFPAVAEWHSYAQQVASQHSLSLDGVVLSNGTLLTPEIAVTMQSLDLRLMISMDGVGPDHDCQRPLADGQGSFDAVARSVDLALSMGLIPDISITVSGRNVDGLPQVVAWALERDLPFGFNFYRSNSLSASQTDLQLEQDRIIAGMLRAYKVIEADLPRSSLLASVLDRVNLATPHCRTCSVGQSYLVFDPLGQVTKCQMDLGNAVTDVNDLDPLATLRESVIGMHNPTVDEKAECGDCQWRYWCAGGCSLMAYQAAGRYDARSPNCGIYQALFPELLRLEGLRLLKYASEQNRGIV